MLRLSFKSTVVLAALALIASTSSLAQQGGLSGKLADASKQLQSDVQTCKPISLGEYQALLNEAAKNKRLAEKAAKKGVPVDMKQVDADLAAASALFNQATTALVQQCIRAAQAQTRADSDRQSSLAPFGQRIVDIQNDERLAVGVPALRRNPALEASATAWAEQIARTGQLVHAARPGRGIERENLQKGLIGWTPERMIQEWLNEKRDFKPGLFPDVANDGDWMNIAHYTQMIWPTTTDVGCGMAQGGGFEWLVCRYSPGGNKDGKKVGFPVNIVRQNPAPQPTSPVVIKSGSVVDSNRGFGVEVVDNTFVYGGEDGKNPAPQAAEEADTKVEQPTLPPKEVFTPKPGAPKGADCGTAECGSADVVTQFVTQCNITVAALCAGPGPIVDSYAGLDFDVPLFLDLLLSEPDMEQPQLPLPEVFGPSTPDKLEDPM